MNGDRVSLWGDTAKEIQAEGVSLGRAFQHVQVREGDNSKWCPARGIPMIVYARYGANGDNLGLMH